MHRNELPNLAVFEYVDGKKGHHYLNVGQAKKSCPGKHFSVNTTTTALSSSKADSRTPKNVRLLGKGRFNLSFFAPNAQDKMKRNQVPVGGIYAVANSRSVNGDMPTTYIHLGEAARGQLVSINTETGALVVSTKGSKNVLHLGEAAVSTLEV